MRYATTMGVLVETFWRIHRGADMGPLYLKSATWRGKAFHSGTLRSLSAVDDPGG
jgi:hypothetical protein